MTPSSPRDYSTISPSARSLLLLKGLTGIPYAREAAEWIVRPETYVPDYGNRELAFWKRVVHFEVRYRTVDALLAEAQVPNVLELSSGFSFRGLNTVRHRAVHYIDTDLPEVIAEKSAFLQTRKAELTEAMGELELRALNALDGEAFRKIVASFPPGPLAIVNEGLLMYLNEAEKRQLCSLIREALEERGGCWITGDVYIKASLERVESRGEDSLKDLVERQHIEDNMFESFDTARAFFQSCGLVFRREARPDFAGLTSLPYLIDNASEAQLAEMRTHPQIQATWLLEPQRQG